MSCCPASYWCTPDGAKPGTTSETTGVTTPPAKAKSGPYASLKEAQQACPVSVECPTCSTPFELPSGAVGVYLSNLVGVPTFTLPAYTELPVVSIYSGGFSYYYYDVAEFPVFTAIKEASYGGYCNLDGGMTVIVQVVLRYTGEDWLWEPVDFAPGWTGYGPWGFSKTFACGQQFDLSSPTYIGRIHYFQSTSIDFTYDVYLGPAL